MGEGGLVAALDMLPSTAARLSTLRKCIIDLEGTGRYATRYGLHKVALEFYDHQLGELLRECCDEDVIIEHRPGRRARKAMANDLDDAGKEEGEERSKKEVRM